MYFESHVDNLAWISVPLRGFVPQCRHNLLACFTSIKCYNSHLSALPLLCRSVALKQRPLTFESGASNWCSGDTTGLIFCEKQGFGGPLINLSAMITTYIREEYIRGGSGPLFFYPALQRGPGGALHAPASHDMLTGKQLIRCQKFIRPLFNIAYLSPACDFKTRGIA